MTVKEDEIKFLTRDAIKYIAMLTMLLNHVGNIFLKTNTLLCELFIAVGYFTAITMIYFLVEGYGYTHSREKYLSRLLIFGLISEIPYCLAFTENGVISYTGLNMMFTLALCFSLIWIFDICKNKFVKIFAALLSIILSLLCSWAILAPIYTLLFIWAKNSYKKTKIAFLISIIIFGLMSFIGGISNFTFSRNILYAVLSMLGMFLAYICIVYFYNGKRVEKYREFSKWFFYWFYPVHLLILGLIRVWVM